MAARAYKTIDDQWADPMWRLNNLYTIIDKEGQRIPFRMNGAQEKLFEDLHTLNAILKARQLGFTTFICLMMLDSCVFNSDTRAGVIAHNINDAQAFFRDKIKFPYDQLDEAIRNANPAVTDSAGSLSFKNNSSLRVGTSLRSGTLNYLLVSEYGKICARYPEKAREIRTGALNTVQAGQFVAIESTAEGKEGDFFALCKRARDLADRQATLGPMDFKFHFAPWWKDKTYAIDPRGVVISEDQKQYFSKLASQGIELDAGQMAWWVKKEETQQDDMKREYPSTPDEAFEAAVEGAYFATQMRIARTQGRICRVPVEPKLPVNTFWDLGMGDYMTIWLHQRHGRENRFVGYYENAGEGFQHYANWLFDWRDRHGAVFGKHFAPHDIEVRNLTEHATTRKEAAANVGIRFETVPRPAHKADGVQASRDGLGTSWFDESACAKGITHLDNYRKDWDANLGTWKSEHRHDEASHGADAYQTFAIADGKAMIVPTARNLEQPMRIARYRA